MLGTKKIIKKVKKQKHLVRRMKKTEVLKKIKKLPWWEKEFDKWLSL